MNFFRTCFVGNILLIFIPVSPGWASRTNPFRPASCGPSFGKAEAWHDRRRRGPRACLDTSPPSHDPAALVLQVLRPRQRARHRHDDRCHGLLRAQRRAGQARQPIHALGAADLRAWVDGLGAGAAGRLPPGRAAPRERGAESEGGASRRGRCLRDLALLGGAAAFLASGYFLLVQCMRTGEVSLTAPFRYTALLFAMLLGYALWNAMKKGRGPSRHRLDMCGHTAGE